MKDGRGSGLSQFPMKNRVLIAVNTYPGHAYCREDFVANLKKLTNPRCDVVIFYNGERNPWGFEDFKKVYYDPKPEERGIDILLAKNKMMRNYFLKRIEYGHIFLLESDNLPPVGTIDRFLEYDKDIMSAVYFIKGVDPQMIKIPRDVEFNIFDHQTGNAKNVIFKKGDPVLAILQKYIPSVWGYKDGKSSLWEFGDFLPQRGPVRILSAGIGSVLVKRDVMRDVDFRLRDLTAERQQFTDFQFYWDAYLKGYEAYVDTDTIAEHYHIDWDSQNFRKWFKADTLEGIPTPEKDKSPQEKVFVKV